MQTGEEASPRIWASRDFTIFCVACFVSNIGGWMQAGAIPFVVYEMTGSAAWVGVAGFVGFIPSMLCTIPGGVLADRFSRGRLLVVTQALLVLTTLPVCLAAIDDRLSITVLLVFLGMQSALLGLGVPAFQTIPGDLVHKNATAAAINANSAQAQIAKTIGPFIAGVVIAQFGAEWAFGINSATYVVSAVAMFVIRNAVPRSKHDGVSLRKSVRTTWQHPSRRLIILLIASAMFLGAPIYQSIAVLADNRLHVGAGVYGLLVGLYGAGAVLGNFINHHVKAKTSSMIVTSLIVYGLAIVSTAWAGSVVVAALSIVAAGCCYLLVSVTLMTSVQLITPTHMRGRVVALFSFAYVGGVPFGNLAQGAVAEQIGISPTLTGAGMLLVALGAGSAFSSKLLDRLDGAEPETIDLREGDRERRRSLADLG